MSFRVLSWNVEAFKGGGTQQKRVVAHIKKQKPDVFALYEVENVQLPSLIQSDFKGYDFHLTDGPQSKEILVGVKRSRFTQAVFTQRRELKVGNDFLRPGALIALRQAGRDYYLLFLHTDSGTEAKDFGNRDAMLGKITSLRRALAKQAGGEDELRFLFAGDLNTMGLLYPSRRKADRRVTETEEIAALAQFASLRAMQLVHKDQPATFNNERFVSDLDHFVVSDTLRLQKLGTRDGQDAFVQVRGWPQLAAAQRRSFIRQVSDHASLMVEVVQ